ncbi:mercuric ion scavenger protein [Haemophilus influenzae KR494]|nr:mercuric ion scavenger protein [Haemophilus influenzae KR494]
MKTITLNIKGIHCGCCVKSLTQVLTELDGVQSADVQLEGKVNITFDENRVNVAQLIEVIEDAGFDATEGKNFNSDWWDGLPIAFINKTTNKE